ncbi:MAG: septum formation inhibitor Maf [Bacillaceae bacterium]|nr:septum formation inhibitor Maf [Bacillaceae bacterium]
MEKRIILASSSPRRKQLMEGMGLNFDVIPSRVDETVSEDLEPSEIVETLALRKASEVAERVGGGIVIGSDTVVVLDGNVLGKPRDESHAFDMLNRLQGRTHLVYSGLAVIDNGTGRQISGHCVTRVHMKSLSPRKIKKYIDSGEPLDKAGSYAIQGIGATLIDFIEGDYFNVVGLPVSLLADYLEELGIDVLSGDRD